MRSAWTRGLPCQGMLEIHLAPSAWPQTANSGIRLSGASIQPAQPSHTAIVGTLS